MPEPVIHANHVCKHYGRLMAVDDLSFDVMPATCFGFLGPNGAGKTTMMQIIYGKCRRDKSEGSEVRAFGYDPKHDELEIKFRSGVVPQENNLDDELNVTQNLIVYSKFYGMKKKEARERIDYLLDFFELSEKRRAKIRELSGGMKRRLVIARSLLHLPKLLILDEPTTGLDPQVRHLIWDKLRQLKKEGLTTLLTTHYMEEAFQLCDSLIIMDRGKKIMEGAPQRLLYENIEPYVLECLNDEAGDRLRGLIDPGTVRIDDTLDRPVFYSGDLNTLKTYADRLEHGAYYLRQSNLEDLFLKTTGRKLNEDQ